MLPGLLFTTYEPRDDYEDFRSFNSLVYFVSGLKDDMTGVMPGIPDLGALVPVDFFLMGFCMLLSLPLSSFPTYPCPSAFYFLASSLFSSGSIFPWFLFVSFSDYFSFRDYTLVVPVLASPVIFSIEDMSVTVLLPAAFSVLPAAARFYAATTLALFLKVFRASYIF